MLPLIKEKIGKWATTEAKRKFASDDSKFVSTLNRIKKDCATRNEGHKIERRKNAEKQQFKRIRLPALVLLSSIHTEYEEFVLVYLA